MMIYFTVPLTILSMPTSAVAADTRVTFAPVVEVATHNIADKKLEIAPFEPLMSQPSVECAHVCAPAWKSKPRKKVNKPSVPAVCVRLCRPVRIDARNAAEGGMEE